MQHEAARNRGATTMQQQEQEQAQPEQPDSTAPQQATPPAETRELTPGVTTNPRVMVGKPVIAGTRIPVEKITGALYGGATIENIMYNYTLTREQIRDALHFAHVLVEEDGQRRIAEARRR